MQKEPALIVISGPPCSGKSALAAALSQRTGIVHLELDRLRVRLMPESTFSETDRNIVYRAMHLIAECHLQHGHSAILDATYGRGLPRQELRQLADRMQAPLRMVQCQVSPATAVQRFINRTAPHFALDLTESLVRTLAEKYPYDPSCLILPEDEPLASRLEQVENYL